MEEIEERSLFERLLSSHGAVAALFVALLYLAGLTTLAVRMRDAGLDLHDTLPLLSLDQLLRAGLTWIYPAIPALVILAGSYAASIYFEHRLRRDAEEFGAERAPGIAEPDRPAWEESFSALCRATDWWKVMDLITEAIKADKDNPRAGAWRRLWRQLALFMAWTESMFLLLMMSCLFLTMVAGIATAAALLLAVFVTKARPAEQAWLPFFAIVAIGFLGSAIFNPQPLPHAKVIAADDAQSQPREWTGDLINISSDAWYIGDENNDVVAIPPSEIAFSVVRSQARKKTLGSAVLDLIERF